MIPKAKGRDSCRSEKPQSTQGSRSAPSSLQGRTDRSSHTFRADASADTATCEKISTSGFWAAHLYDAHSYYMPIPERIPTFIGVHI